MENCPECGAPLLIEHISRTLDEEFHYCRCGWNEIDDAPSQEMAEIGLAAFQSKVDACMNWEPVLQFQSSFD